MIDKFDYAEPACPLSGGHDFYYPKKGAPLGRIPIERIIRRLDGFFDKNDYEEAGKLLVYWRAEAIALKDKSGELSMESELVGFYRKQNDREKGLASVERAIELVEELKQGELVSGATIFINCATAYKAFGMAEKAQPLFARAKEIYEKMLPPDDARLGGLYNNMGLNLVDMGNFEAAEAAYRAAIAVMEKVPGGEADAAITYINMAHMYESFQCMEKIDGCMEKAYELLQSEKLSHNGYYAFVLEKCAPSFGHFGKVDVYEKLKRESERIYAGS